MVYNFPSSTSLLCSAFEDAWVDDVIQMLKYKQTCTLSRHTPPIFTCWNKDLKSIQSIHAWTKDLKSIHAVSELSSPNMHPHKMHIVPVILKTHIEPMIILWSVYAAGSSSLRNQESTQSQANKREALRWIPTYMRTISPLMAMLCGIWCYVCAYDACKTITTQPWYPTFSALIPNILGLDNKHSQPW